MTELPLAAAVGFGAGVLSGAFGIGGGIVTTPAIRLLMGASAIAAVATPLPAVIPTALTGAITYGRHGMVDLRTGALVALAGMPAAVAGALLADRVGGTLVLLATAGLVILAGADTIAQVRRPRSSAEMGSDGAAQARTPSVVAPLGIGLLAGIYSGFFGLGGGFVLVPLLMRLMRMGIKRAIGTSLLAVTVLAIPGTVTHALLGNVDWAIAGGLILGVVPGAAIGARLTLRAGDRAVQYGFAGLLFVVGVWLAASELMGVLQ